MTYTRIFVFIALFTGGCQMTNVQSDQNSENQKMFFVLKEAKLFAPNGVKPDSFYVSGHLKDGNFVADSEVLGEGHFETNGQRGWLELSTGKFYAMHTAQSPVSPYVEGVMTPNGFVPSTREVK